MYSNDNESSSDDNGQSQALPVGALPPNFDPKKQPATAEEYLQHVMWEAKQYDSVVTVKLDKKRVKEQPVVVNPGQKAFAPRDFLPTQTEQAEILAKFKVSKAEVDKKKLIKVKPAPPTDMPKDENADHWCKFCFGDAFFQSVSENESDSKKRKTSEEKRVTEAHQPLLSVLLNVKQTTLQNLMEWHVDWLQKASITEHQVKWMYALLSCLEKPLTPELCDNVRQVVFVCSNVRAKLDSASHPLLPKLNLIITIVTRYFGQEDLADSG